MRVEFLFSRRNKASSRLIAWAAKWENLELKEIPSHTAILINGRFVIESVFGQGVRIVPFDKWAEFNEELYRIPSNDISREEFDATLLSAWGKKYDWRGILYFAYRYILLMLLNWSLPKKNKWQRNTHLFCIELVGRLSGTYYSMTSPAKMCAQLLGGL